MARLVRVQLGEGVENGVFVHGLYIKSWWMLHFLSNMLCFAGEFACFGFSNAMPFSCLKQKCNSKMQLSFCNLKNTAKKRMSFMAHPFLFYGDYVV